MHGGFMSQSNIGSGEKLTFTDRLRAHTHFLIAPFVGLLMRLGVAPNVITVTGMVLHVVPAWLIGMGQIQWAAIALLVIAPFDSLDGALARQLGKSSQFGAFLDSTLDRVAEIILFGGFLVFYSDDVIMQIVSFAAITGSLMVSYTRARAEGLGYSCKVGLLSRVERYLVIILLLLLNLPQVALIVLAIFTYITMLQRILHVQQQAVNHD